MARKPAHLEQAGPVPTGRRAIWAAIRAHADGFTRSALVRVTGIHRDTVGTYLRGLEAAGYIGRPADLNPPSIPAAPVWRLVKDVGVEAPRVTRDGRPVTQGLAREQMWRTMRMLKGDWSWRDLAIAASTEAQPVSETDARDYCANLAKAGYLVIVARGKGVGSGLGKGGTGLPTRYRFVPARYSGPRPPMIQRLSTVFDPNLGTVVWQESPRDDD